jgi:hypothetical protein
MRDGRSRASGVRSFGCAGARLRFLRIGFLRIAVVFAIGEERRQARSTGVAFGLGLIVLGAGRTQRLRQPPRASQQPLGFLRHLHFARAPCRWLWFECCTEYGRLTRDQRANSGNTAFRWALASWY